MAARITEEEYKNRLKLSNANHGARDIRLVSGYVNIVTKALHSCNKCGYTWNVQPNNLLYGQNCPGCHSNGNTKSLDEIKKQVQDAYDYSEKDIYVVSVIRTPSMNKRLKQIVKINLRCSLGHEWQTSYANASRASGCPKCAGRDLTTATLIEKLRDKFGKSLDYSKVEFKTQQDFVTLTCPKHGDFSVKVLRLLQRKHGCSECAKEKVVASHFWDKKKFIREAKRIHGDRYDYSKVVYTHSHVPVTIICKEHGPWTVFPYNHIHSMSGCPDCSTLISKPHTFLLKVLDNKSINYKSNLRGLIGKKELDIYLPDNKAAIEINGVYWHSNLHVDKNYHYDKALLCKKAGIRLVQFWDYEIYDKKHIVLSMIRNLVGKSKRIFARKLILCWIDPQQANFWFNKHHIQGKVYGKSETIALMQGNKILCAASFGKSRYSNLAEWELLRFANHVGYSVVGGASRLFKEFQRKFNPKAIISYADLRYSQGNLYKSLGFVLHHRTQPNYIYIGNNKRISRYKAQKHRLQKLLGPSFDPNLSETANMRLNGYHKLYDAGNLCYIWHCP